jgi:flagellar biosynthesis anti-sigma factor FlgM
MNVRNGIENLGQILTPAGTGGVSSPASAGKSSGESLGTDQARVSVTAGQLAQSAAGSDVRLDKVSSIQQAIQAGTYNVPASAVAQKVLTSMLAQH